MTLTNFLLLIILTILAPYIGISIWIGVFIWFVFNGLAYLILFVLKLPFKFLGFLFNKKPS